VTNQQPTTPPDDSAIAALRQVADHTTVHSIKRTILTCMIIRAINRPPPRRRTVITTSALGLTSLAAIHWHAWSLVIHILH